MDIDGFNETSYMIDRLKGAKKPLFDVSEQMGDNERAILQDNFDDIIHSLEKHRDYCATIDGEYQEKEA